MSVSHSPHHALRPVVAEAPHDAAPNDFGGRHLFSHVLFTLVLLMALAAMVAWLLT